MGAKKTNEISISDLINILKSRWISLLVVGILVAAISFAYSSFFIVPQYRATAQMFVDTRRESSDGKDTYIQSSHITAAKELASTYVYIIKTNTVLNAVINDLGLDMSYSALSSKISVSVVDETQILKVNVTDENKDRALKIAQKLVELTPTIINAKIDSGKLILIDDPAVSKNPVSPNIANNTLIGFLVGVVALYTFYIVSYLLDNKIKSVDDIQRVLDLPVLGVIPSLEKIASK